MKTILIFIFIFSFPIYLLAQSDTLYRITDPSIEQWEPGYDVGYADTSGKMVIPFGKYKFCYSEKFNKIAFVGFYNRPGIYAINRKEKVLFEVFIFDFGPDQISENTFRIKRHGKIGFADINGRTIISPRFDAAWSFREGLTGVSIGGTTIIDTFCGHNTYIGKWKFINKKGKVINNEEYDAVRPFKDGQALVMKNEKWGKINKKGETIVPIKYSFETAAQQ